MNQLDFSPFWVQLLHMQAGSNLCGTRIRSKFELKVFRTRCRYTELEHSRSICRTQSRGCMLYFVLLYSKFVGLYLLCLSVVQYYDSIQDTMSRQLVYDLNEIITFIVFLVQQILSMGWVHWYKEMGLLRKCLFFLRNYQWFPMMRVRGIVCHIYRL